MEHTDPWFDALFRAYTSKFVDIASLALNDWALAEQIAQDVFLFLLLNREKIEKYDHPGVWLYKVLYNRIGNEMQRANRHFEIPFRTEHERIPDDSKLFQKLEDVLPEGLTEAERQILIWFYEDNLDCSEIGKRLHRTAHACEGRLYRARKRCKELLLKKNEKTREDFPCSTNLLYRRC